ncbi:MAG: GAF domain-containing protein [Anaerolineales bacterium]
MSDLATSSSIAQERALRSINQAVLAVASKLSLEETLQQIADSAREITSARYAAIGEFNPAGEIETFITSGMPAEEAESIPHEPKGEGLLGAIMELRQPLRVPEITKDPRSVGFPENHPTMGSFLGVPIVSGTTVLGNLYLTDKETESEFTAEDEELIVTLSHHAAVAIENAHLYEASQARARELKARNRELAAINSLARAMSEHGDIETILSRALSEVLAVTGMPAGEIFLINEATGKLQMASHAGADQQEFHTIEQFDIGQGIPGRVVESGEPFITSDLSKEKAYLRKEVIELGYRTFICIPIRIKGTVIGTLDLASKSDAATSEREIALLETIGHQIGVAVENARLYEEIERLAIVEERSRIGMDLHDGVIQSIYAVGLTLETTRLLLGKDPEQAESLLDSAVEGLNDVIRDIRNFILDLRPRQYEGDLRSGLNRLVREFQANTMIEIDVDVPEALASAIPTSPSRAMVLTAQEALANVARHARATRVWLSLRQQDSSAVLTVTDNGRGFDPEQRSRSVGHGLANMESRAHELGGSFSVVSEPGEGTTIRLSIPLSEDPNSSS